MANTRTLKEAVEIARHPMNEGKPFGFVKQDGKVRKLGYVVRKGKTVYYLNVHGKTEGEVRSVDYLN